MKDKRTVTMSISIMAVTLLVLAGMVYNNSSVQAYSSGEVQAEADNLLLLQATGYITMLRVHELGTGYGPADDFIDTEVVIHLDSEGGRGFGLKLRNDDERLAARQGMLDVLRDGFNHNWIVTINYLIEPGKNNGEIIRVWLTKPLEPQM